MLWVTEQEPTGISESEFTLSWCLSPLPFLGYPVLNLPGFPLSRSNISRTPLSPSTAEPD